MARSAPFVGQMDRRIAVYKTVKVTEATGERVESLELVCEPRARMNDVSGSQEAEGAIMNVVNRSYTIRRRPDILGNWREMQIKDANQVFAVHAIKEIARTHIELLVTAIENNGAFAE